MMKNGFAYKNGKLVNIFCGKEELYNELKAFLVKTFSINVKEVSRPSIYRRTKSKQLE
ncbi:hypothetical protein BHY07_06645 [Bacillus subtilis subsp. subtilis]|uniref:Uncharacterized protein YjzG n=3 Tax=Bacillus subtilis subsp. subtilis TaxID=135461 RepID=YJZG_BACSU|nr:MULTISPECIES: hypothetical protein [Bacillales]YP_003097708.1 hypothetical protein BSU_11929 [Bacillus subtilis subsp. subtilis str. 168]C0H3Z1.1 RecName: Full=Uncharacterized protein YjzG [Bacillus subtilis subsp. subtilis str. 168]BAM50117.1 hypothetical protein BEST7613_1186 [Bacillus subtilis BEST7613]AGG60547.1 YjzG [Bacillus subtilis subsp. subtilis 6051-HGW]AHA77181.1 Uncharacterized protein yjzG [Bacillus subtilis PY79]AIY92478.1 hypothetical protein QU35_06660 [Bacillus subtilis s